MNAPIPDWPPALSPKPTTGFMRLPSVVIWGEEVPPSLRPPTGGSAHGTATRCWTPTAPLCRSSSCSPRGGVQCSGPSTPWTACSPACRSCAEGEARAPGIATGGGEGLWAGPVRGGIVDPVGRVGITLPAPLAAGTENGLSPPQRNIPGWPRPEAIGWAQTYNQSLAALGRNGHPLPVHPSYLDP